MVIHFSTAINQNIMNNLTSSEKKITIIYGVIFSLLILPFGRSYSWLSAWASGIDNSPSSLLFYLILLLTPILFIYRGILSRKSQGLADWRSLIWLFFFTDVAIFVAHKISVVNELGYANLAPLDILLRIGIMTLLFILINKWVQITYPIELHEKGKAIVKLFGITQIILFSVSTIGNFIVLVTR